MRLSKNVYKQIRKFEFQVFHSFIFGLMTVYLCATLLVFAGARSVPYGPGDTLDPDCAPYDTNCFVQLSNNGGGGGGSSSDNHFTSIHVSGGSISVASPSSTTTSINYNTDVGYPDNGYAHNYRVYSYKDTPSGRVYSSTYASIPAPEGTIGDPANLQITQQPTEDTGKYLADGKSFNFRIYAFKNVPGGRVYSSNYAALQTDFTDDNAGLYYTLGLTWDPVDGADGYRILKSSSTGMAYDYGHDVLTNSYTDDNSASWSQNPIITTSEGILDQNQSQLLYTVNLSWDAVPGADGYRIVKSNQNTNIGYSYFGYLSQHYDVGYDTTSTSLIDDACNNVCFDPNKGDVSLTTSYGESSDLNGLFSLSGPILLNSDGYLNWGGTSGSDGYGIRDNAGILEYKNSNGTWSSFVTSGSSGGTSDGITVDYNNYSVFTGGGFNSYNSTESVFIGDHAGSSASGSSDSVFIGNSAGNYSSNANNSNFIGKLAGNNATNASYSSFIGSGSGNNANNANNSFFGGFQAGQDAPNAANSLFLGTNAGVNDQVNNINNNGYSILIGPWTNTNGYSNSIALGKYAMNTSENQFMIGNSGYNYPINQVVINGSNAYLNFTGTAGYDGYGIRDNGGTLEYKNSGGSWSALGVGANGVNLDGNNNFILGGGNNSVSSSNFIGLNAGQSVTNGSFSNFLGQSAGDGAVNAYNSNFIGYYTGEGAINSNNANFIGNQAGRGATGANRANFIGQNSGQDATDAYNSNFFGQDSGRSALYAANSNFFGYNSGYSADSAHDSNFLGSQAGFQAYNSQASNFFGPYSGYNSDNAYYSNFFGDSAGFQADDAYHSNFFGQAAGSGAINADHSNFFGSSAGINAINASESIFIGVNSGANDTVDNTSNSGYSILLGPYTNTGGYSNSIALGKYAVNTATNQLMLGDTTNGYPINQLVINGSNAYLNFGPTSGSDGYGIRDNDGTLEYKNSGGSWSALGSGGGGGGGVSLDGNGNFILGGGATNASSSNFLGQGSGSGAINVSDSNFFGVNSGYGATNADHSNFFGINSGLNATDADHSNFFGINSGLNATDADHSNFFGYNAGNNAISANGSNFIGYTSGYDATNADHSNFFGYNAGVNANNASDSNFIGQNAGQDATNASYSNFFGYNAGIGSINASDSNFFGNRAGEFAESALESNFFGTYSGSSASAASYSNFIGYTSGYGATNASESNFFGSGAGYNASNAMHSNFMGNVAGTGATNASYSNFFGYNAGYHATNAHHSNFISPASGYNATNASYSNFIGSGAGLEATNASYSNFIGSGAGNNSTNAANSIFIGKNSGTSDSVDNTSNSGYSILLGSDTSTGGYSNSIALGGSATNTAANQFMIGSSSKPINQLVINGTNAYLNFTGTAGSSGYGLRNNGGTIEYKNSGGSWAALNTVSGSPTSPIVVVNSTSLFSNALDSTGSGSVATNSIFLGPASGNRATNASYSNFIGYVAGQDAPNATGSNFFGLLAGIRATDASYSNFIGVNAGDTATNASYSNLLGYRAGNENGSGIHMGSNNIVIGTNISLPDAAANSINIGGILFGSNTYSTTSGNASVVAKTNGMIGIATLPSYTLDVGNSSVSGTVARFTNSTGSCLINPTSGSTGCSSDITLKKNVIPLSASALDKIISLKPVTYNWKTESNTDPVHIGFIAQDVEKVFPDLVSIDKASNTKILYMTDFIPYTIKAIQEMNMKVSLMPTFTDPTLYSKISEFLKGIAEKGTAIVDSVITKKVKTDELCVGNVCVTSEQFLKMVQSSSTQQVSTK